MFHRRALGFIRNLRTEQQGIIQGAIEKGDVPNLRAIRYMTGLHTILPIAMATCITKPTGEHIISAISNHDGLAVSVGVLALTTELGTFGRIAYGNLRHTMRLTNAINNQKGA